MEESLNDTESQNLDELVTDDISRENDTVITTVGWESDTDFVSESSQNDSSLAFEGLMNVNGDELQDGTSSIDYIEGTTETYGSGINDLDEGWITESVLITEDLQNDMSTSSEIKVDPSLITEKIDQYDISTEGWFKSKDTDTITEAFLDEHVAITDSLLEEKDASTGAWLNEMITSTESWLKSAVTTTQGLEI